MQTAQNLMLSADLADYADSCAKTISCEICGKNPLF